MSERFPHDAAYKDFFSDPAMVESLLRDFVPEDFIQDLDFSTLERCFGSYVTDDLRERHDDIIWRISWKKDKWCYAVLIFEFQSSQDHWMALRILSYTALLLLDLVKSGKVREQDGLPPVFPIVVYNTANGASSSISSLRRLWSAVPSAASCISNTSSISLKFAVPWFLSNLLRSARMWLYRISAER